LRSKFVLRLAVALAVAFLGLELVLRLLLFGSGDLARSYGWKFRQARYFASPDTDSFWALDGQFSIDSRDAAPYPDAELGWLSWDVLPGTYEHRGLDPLDGRRPILLYGDSFSACMTKASDCYQSLLERSDLGATHVLLNHAVSGHGLGQIQLMLRSTVERYAERDPIAVVGIFVDDDLERTGLSLRQFPKPRFFLEDGALAHEPPHPGGRRAWLETHRVGIPSYVWSLFAAKGARLSPGKASLNRAVLEAIRDELARLEIEMPPRCGRSCARTR